MLIYEILSVIENPIIPLDTQNIRVVIVDNDGIERRSNILSGLDKQASLTDTRKKLSLNDKILMSKQNSHFWNDNKYRISQDDENNYTLQDILIPKTDHYNLYVAVDPSKPNFLEISKKLQLNKGRKTRDNSDNTYVMVNKSAFTIKNPHMINVNLQSKFERVHDREMEEYIKICYELGSVRLSRKDLAPNEDYVRAIEEALDESKSNDEKKRNLDIVGEEYGFFW
ncbi:20842_t:CDS:1 [Dentiscutata erythropus]|uniref:20842_t:CDS:1 n=1 Tax=Dentiscutata erythropus TaxID=1348616 RepID=A0A9N9J2A7_9GLOM|nr:20842_t:CDS:1 [Dentiscutata erythropus]